jgi:hypothetical protein
MILDFLAMKDFLFFESCYGLNLALLDYKDFLRIKKYLSFQFMKCSCYAKKEYAIISNYLGFQFF